MSTSARRSGSQPLALGRDVNQDIFAPGFKTEPYWYEEAPLVVASEPSLPEAVDVAIVGSGYTGLSAALTLGRAGRSVLVLDAEDPGAGCSSRNGGMLGEILKVPYDVLIGRYGKSRAIALLREGMAALDYTRYLIESEGIACHFQPVGKFVGAWRPSHYDRLARSLDFLHREIGYEAEMVPASAQNSEIGSEIYHGGRIEKRQAGLHPALYHKGLLERVTQAGVAVAGRTPVLAVTRQNGGFRVETTRRTLSATDVIVATNGYTGDATPAFRRRLIPVGSYMIATEPLAPERMARLIPKRRMIVDTKKMLYYFRPSPDGTRILFGGRAAVGELDARTAAKKIHRLMTGVYPELGDVPITHAWRGFVAMTFDQLPHIGRQDGIYFAAGYNGSGVAPSTYFGHKVALKLLGDPEGATAFDDLPFRGHPLYRRRPWFLPWLASYYRLKDRYGR